MTSLKKSLLLACALSVVGFGAATAQQNTNSNPNDPSQSPGMIKPADPAMAPMDAKPAMKKPMKKHKKKHMKKM